MKYNNIDFNDELKNRIYLKTLDKIVNYEEKHAKKLRLVGIFSLTIAVIIMIFNILVFIPHQNNKNSMYTKNETQIDIEEEYMNTYGEFFSFTNDSNDLTNFSDDY